MAEMFAYMLANNWTMGELVKFFQMADALAVDAEALLEELKTYNSKSNLVEVEILQRRKRK